MGRTRLAVQTNSFPVASGVSRVALGQPRAYLSAMTEELVNLTSAAARRVLAIAERQGAPARLRLAVDGGGCSGFTYRFALADGVADDDSVTQTDGAELVVDAISLDLLRGAEVDFVESLSGTAFQVRNPNAASGCGCGSSFAI